MSTTTLASTAVELNEDGFFVHPEQWTEAMAPELARRLVGSGVTANCLHPGTVATSIWSHAPWYTQPFLSVAKMFMSSVAQGADTIVYLAASPEVEGDTGGYYEIALTNRQVVVAFIILLVCLLSAFFSGVWIGREGTAARVAGAAEDQIRDRPTCQRKGGDGYRHT